MSLFCSVQFFQNASQAEIARAIQAAGRESRSFISPVKNGWVTVYDEKTEEAYDCDDFEAFMKQICTSAMRSGYGLWVIGSYYLCLWAYDGEGNLLAGSNPDDSEAMSVPQRIGLGGELSKFLAKNSLVSCW